MLFSDHNYIIQFTVLKLWVQYTFIFIHGRGATKKRDRLSEQFGFISMIRFFLQGPNYDLPLINFGGLVCRLKKARLFSIKITFHIEAIMQLFYDSGSGSPNYLVSVCEFIKAFCRQSLMLQINFQSIQ
jgi:hypothetical protein